MRKFKTRFFTLVVLFILSCLCAVGCIKEPDVPIISEQEAKYTIELNNSALSVNRFETATLNVTVKKDGIVVASPNVEWKSENENVATVVDGLITPVDYGTTVVTVRYENVAASCQVTIEKNGFVPALMLDVEQVQLLISSDPVKVNASVFYESAEKDTSSAVITYAIADGGQTIASVDENGYVTAVGVGETSLTVSAIWKGYDGIGMTKTIPVYVNEDIETRIFGGAKEIYLAELVLDGQTFANKTTFSIEVFKNLEKVENPTITWVSSNPEVATVDGGVVTAVAEGETSVYALYNDGETVFESNKETVKVAMPIIDKTEILSFDLDQSNVGYNTVSAKAIFGDSYTGSIVKVTEQAKADNLLSENGLDASTLSTGNNVLVVYNEDNYAFKVTAQVYTRIIKTKADLQAFGEAFADTADNTDTNATNGWKVVLANDIDYENDNYCKDVGYTTSDRWLGSFDGRGFTISNMTTNFGFFGWIGTKAELKNTGFININKTSSFQGGLLANQLYGKIDNCFVQASMVLVNSKRTGGIVNTLYSSGKLMNSIAIVEFVEGDSYTNAVYNAIAAVIQNEASLINTYAISASAQNSYGAPDLDTLKDTNLYRTVAAFKTAHPDLTAGEFEDYADFWLMTNGVPMFEEYMEVLQTLEITNGETDVKPGDMLQMTANFAGVSFVLANEYEGITITSDGLLSVAENAPNATIVVKAVSPYSDSIYATKTILLLTITEETITQSLGEIVLKKDGVAVATDYVISASDIQGTVNKIQTVKTGEEIAFTIDGTTIALNNADVQNAITMQDGGAFGLVIYTNSYKYTANVMVVSLEISTKAGLDYFATTIYRGAANITSNDKTNATYGVYVKLVDDINYGGGEYPNNGSGTYADHNNYAWEGTFDGCGNIISNICVRRGFFCIVGTLGTVKNLALTEVTNNYNYQFGVLCNQVYGAIDNCFVQASIITTKAGATSATSKNRGGIFNAAYRGANYSASITNCIAVVEFETEATNHYAIGRTIDGTSYGQNAILENCYAISSAPRSVGTSTDGLYENVSAFKAEMATLPDGFNSFCTYTLY